MSPLLRRPNAVPSMFSRGSEWDEDARPSDRPSDIIADRLENFAVALGLSDERTLLGRSGRALVGTSFGIVMIGLPVMEATRLVVAMSLDH